VYHARVWRDALLSELAAHPEDTEAALTAAEDAARALWKTLDGIESARQARMTAAVA
jgi:hypothetical protein